jgi:hypothetical protein
MKIRNGFVSNSSSSSFVISTDDFSSVRDLATYMLKQKIKESRYYNLDDGITEDDEYINSDKVLIKRLKNIDKDDPVSFPSCNYDTYIRRVGDYYMVATCNNTEWDLHDYSVGMSNELRQELLKLSEYYSNIGDEETLEEINSVLQYEYDFSHFGKDYYALNEEVKGVEIFDRCPKCDHYMWKTQKFGKICLKCNPYYKRKDKLEKINLINNGKK